MSLFQSPLFNLNKPLARCFVQALYCVALVLIALGLLRGIVQGARMMSGPPPAVMAQAPPPAAAPVPGAPAMAMPPPRRPGFGPPGRRFRGPRPGFVMGGGLLRGMPPPVLGAARILGALFVAAVMTMVVRVLAELANAVLAMGAKARE
jgi:hypothetical protein